jgi:heme exporter protein D
MSISEFFAMGGYGFYIWMSYGVTALFMVAEVVIVLRNKRTIMQQLSRTIRLNKTQVKQ